MSSSYWAIGPESDHILTGSQWVPIASRRYVWAREKDTGEAGFQSGRRLKGSVLPPFFSFSLFSFFSFFLSFPKQG